MLKFLADNTGRPEAQAITVEPKRPVQVVNAEGDNGDSRLHAGSLFDAERCVAWGGR